MVHFLSPEAIPEILAFAAGAAATVVVVWRIKVRRKAFLACQVNLDSTADPDVWRRVKIVGAHDAGADASGAIQWFTWDGEEFRPLAASDLPEPLVKQITDGEPMEVHPLVDGLDMITINRVHSVRSSVPVDASFPSRTALPTPEEDGLVRLRGPREVRTGGAAAEEQAARPAPSRDDGGEG